MKELFFTGSAFRESAVGASPIREVKQVSFPSRVAEPIFPVSVSGLSRYKTKELLGSDKVISAYGDNRGGTANEFRPRMYFVHLRFLFFC